MQLVENPARERVYLRALLMGPTGSGKSRGAIELATRLFDGKLPVVLINSERGRGTLYLDRYKLAGYIGLDEEGDFSPESWEDALDLAESKHPGGIYLLDSASHEWMGNNGILQQADRFGDWKTVRPKHNGFVDRLLRTEGHLIVCVRAKMKYEVAEEDVPGRSKPRQVIRMLGVGPIQSDDFQYEFNLVGRFEQATHEVEFSGHVDPLGGKIFDLIEAGGEVATILEGWLSEGDPVVIPEADEAEIAKLRASLDAEGITTERIETGFAAARKANRGKLHPDYVADNLARSEGRLEKVREKAALAAQESASDAASPPDDGVPVPASGDEGEAEKAA